MKEMGKYMDNPYFYNEADQEKLKFLLNGIVETVTVEFIYLNQTILGENPIQEVIILVSNKYVRILNELIPVLNMAFSGQRVFNYRVFHLHEVKNALADGSLFLSQVCQPINCIYSKPGNASSLDLPKPLEDAIANIKATFMLEVEKVDAFFKGAQFYLEQGNYEHSAFMLHQVFDLMYRALEIMIMGRDKKTHYIRAHQIYIKTYVPALSAVFDEYDETSIYLLGLLDEAYLAVRYENKYHISTTELMLIFERLDLLKKIANKVHKQLLRPISVYEYCSPSFTL